MFSRICRLINSAARDCHQELHIGLEDERLPFGLSQGALLHRPDVGGVEEALHDHFHGGDLELLVGGDTQRTLTICCRLRFSQALLRFDCLFDMLWKMVSHLFQFFSKQILCVVSILSDIVKDVPLSLLCSLRTIWSKTLRLLIWGWNMAFNFPPFYCVYLSKFLSKVAA